MGFVNLGCTKNQVDSEIMLGTLAADGFELTGNPNKAEVVIINTCGFIEEAKQESINTILEHAKLKQSGACRVLIAAGCLAQRYQGDLLKELPELDGVVGTGEFGTYFIGYSRTPDVTEEMLRNMFLGREPGQHDRILDFSVPVTGCLFHVPTIGFLDDLPAAPGGAATAGP